jgi:hypothetical protein
MWAAKNGRTEAVKALIEKGADMNATEQVRRRHFFSVLFQPRVSTGEGMND